MSRKKGVTLIEILSSLAIFSVIVVSAGIVLYNVYRDWHKQRMYAGCISGAYWAAERMATELRQAQAALVFQTTSPSVWRVRFRTPASESTSRERIWYWRGDNASVDDEDDTFGYEGAFYRAQTDDDSFDASGSSKAHYQRQTLAGQIVANPSGNNIVTESASPLVVIELTLRPYPDKAEGPNNRNYTVKTTVRRRN